MGLARWGPKAGKHEDAIMRCLDDFVDDPDEWIRAAAQWGKSCDEATYHTQATQ
jgi:hypothetical protein